jgi:hypothetical protein
MILSLHQFIILSRDFCVHMCFTHWQTWWKSKKTERKRGTWKRDDMPQSVLWQTDLCGLIGITYSGMEPFAWWCGLVSKCPWRQPLGPRASIPPRSASDFSKHLFLLSFFIYIYPLPRLWVQFPVLSKIVIPDFIGDSLFQPISPQYHLPWTLICLFFRCYWSIHLLIKFWNLTHHDHASSSR